MIRLNCDDGVALHVEESGQGDPIIFAHEFGGDLNSWDGQVAALATDYRCIRYAARGFLPSDVPSEDAFYGQERSTRDVLNIADALGLARFHLVGLSMGSFTSLMVTLKAPQRVLSLTLAGCSSGPSPQQRDKYRADLAQEIELLDRHGGEGAVRWFAEDSAYRRMPEKVPQQWQAYCDRLRAQSVDGARRTLRTLHWNRICLWERTEELRALNVPTLLVYGTEDHPLIAPTNQLLLELLPQATSLVLPGTGHLVNIEEAAAFNTALQQHLQQAG